MSGRPLGRWLFGKLPTRGDFVSRGLDHETRDRLDAWLSCEMEAARERFGADFETRYDVAPAWNFVDCGSDGRWTGGALCGSVDAAGRRFPAVMAAPAATAEEAVGVSGGCLALLYDAFAGSWDADRLHAAEVSPGEVCWRPETSEWALLAQDGPALVMPGRYPEGVVAAMIELAA